MNVQITSNSSILAELVYKEASAKFIKYITLNIGIKLFIKGG